MVDAFTPSALSTILLCAGKDKDHDYATIYAALRRHLSTSHADRLYNESETWSLSPSQNGPPHRRVRQSFFFFFLCNLWLNSIDANALLDKTIAFTVPYFRLTDDPPAVDKAPLFPSGIFGISGLGRKYIREEKYTLSWTGGLSTDEPSLMVAFNPILPIKMTEGEQFKIVRWVRNNFVRIVRQWERVLDSLDEQTTLPVR